MPEILKNTVLQYGVLFVGGGNVFVLRRAFRQSGLDQYLDLARENKEQIYAGYSAGSCVLAPTLKGLHLVDDPNEVPSGYADEIIWDGCGLIEYSIAPHFDSDHLESGAMNSVIEFYEASKLPFRALRDGEVIIEDS